MRNPPIWDWNGGRITIDHQTASACTKTWPMVAGIDRNFTLLAYRHANPYPPQGYWMATILVEDPFPASLQSWREKYLADDTKLVRLLV